MSKTRHDEEVLVRSPRLTWLLGIITGVVVLTVVISTITALMEPQTYPCVSCRPLGVAIMAVMAFGFLALGISFMRCGVLVHRDGITVRNVRRLRRVSWDEIDRFTVEPLAHSTMGRVHLRDGETFNTWGIQGPNRFLFRNSVEATEPIAQLNALLQQCRSNAATGAASHGAPPAR